jgi:hypothetical protein
VHKKVYEIFLMCLLCECNFDSSISSLLYLCVEYVCTARHDFFKATHHDYFLYICIITSILYTFERKERTS